MVLNGQRQWSSGMAAIPQPIPYSEIAAYAKDHLLPLDDAVALLSRMDATWREAMLERTKPAVTPNGG